jgi:hypothetical protein
MDDATDWYIFPVFGLWAWVFFSPHLVALMQGLDRPRATFENSAHALLTWIHFFLVLTL